MYSKELRIDNYLMTKEGNLCQVELIHKKHFDCRDAETGTFIPNGSYKSVKLTNRWLCDFGFDDSEYKEGYTGVEFRSNMILDFVLCKPKTMGEWQEYYCFELSQHRFVQVKYVHQLQNLFFDITGGKELTYSGAVAQKIKEKASEQQPSAEQEI